MGGTASVRRFRDRAHAGRALAEHLEPYRDQAPVVLALPRGGAPVGFEVARALGAPLDVLVVRKLGAPRQPELGIGAVAPGGVRVLMRWIEDVPEITPEYVVEVTAREMREMARRMALYRDDRPPPDLAGRTAILVDDGLATGVSARAAIRSARLLGAARTVFAAPVCARQTAEALGTEVEAVVCAQSPDDLRAISQWYDEFLQTEDDEVMRLLAVAAAERGGRAP